MMGRHGLRSLGLVLFIMMACSFVSLAATRDLYVGDIIELTIDDNSHSEEAIRKAFSTMDIVELDLDEAGYKLKVRSFETGSHDIILDNQSLVIEVHSTLDVIDRQTIFPGEIVLEEGGMAVYWRGFLYTFMMVSLVSGIWLFIRKLKVKQAKVLEPYEALKCAIDKLPEASDQYLGQLNHCLKGYFFKRYNLDTKGMTTGELIDALRTCDLDEASVNKIEGWLSKSDAYKFSNLSVEASDNKQMATELLEIIGDIHEERGLGL